MESTIKIPSRFKSLDFMKGLALVLILESHLGIWWGDGTWTSAWTLMELFIRPLGPTNFIMISIFGMILSLNIRDKAAPGKSELPRLLKRSFVFIVIGTILTMIELTSEIANPSIFFGYKLARIFFTWNIFTYLGFVQIIIYFFRRLNVKIQIVCTLAVFIFFYITVPIVVQIFINRHVDYVTGNVDLSSGMTGTLFVYFTLFFENSMAPLIPYIATSFLVCIVYTKLLDICSSKEIERSKLAAEFRAIKWKALVLIIAGIATGFMLSPGLIGQVEYQRLIEPFIIQVGSNTYVSQLWDPVLGGYPLFLQQNNPSYILYSFGLVSMISMALLERIDIPGKNPAIIDVLARFGMYSLSVFLTHAIASYIPLSFGFLAFFGALAIVAAGYIVVLDIWDYKWKGKFTIEYWLKLFLSTDISVAIKKRRALKKATIS